MALLMPCWMQGGSYPSSVDRVVIDALCREGVMSGTDLKVSQRASGGADMSVDVAAGIVCIEADLTAYQGKYLCRSTAVTNVAIAAAPSAGNSRIDLIVAKVRDATIDGGGDNDWVIIPVSGTASSTPSAPSLPANCARLATVTVTDSTTTVTNGIIVDTRRNGRIANPSMHDYTSPGTQTLTGSYANWDDVGGPATVTQPNYAVTTEAHMVGLAAALSPATSVVVSTRIGLDIGAGFQWGPDMLTTITNFYTPMTISALVGIKDQRPTGPIQARIQVKQTSPASNYGSVTAGRLFLSVYPS